MKALCSCFLFVLLFISACKRVSPDPKQTVNAVLGDISLREKYGFVPENLDENVRIKTHLAYVEKLLRKHEPGNLNKPLKANRFKLLEKLHTYWVAGKFPKNYDHPNERRPCFIDKDGNICAVGFLIQQTAGPELANKINAAHQYDRIFDMKTPELLAWVNSSGLTLEECAMIQPAYGPTPSFNYNYISTGYGVSSAILGGTNLSLSALNLTQIAQESGSKVVPVLGLASGVGSVLLGVANLENEEQVGFGMYPNTNESKKALSMLNIGLGTSTIVLSTWNLLTKKEPEKEKKMSWNVYSFPTQSKEMGVGFSINRKI